MRDVDENDDGHKYWMEELKKGAPRRDVENYFRQNSRKIFKDYTISADSSNFYYNMMQYKESY